MQKYHETIRSLSPALKGEVVSWMYGDCFKRVWYFKDVVDERCARLLTEGMVPRMYAKEEWIEDTVDGVRCLLFLRSGLCVRKCNLLAPGACWGLDVILGSEEHHDIESLLDKELARSINFVFVLKLSKISIDRAASTIPEFARRLRKAHLRMLFWRGVIAAARATKRLQTPAELQHSDTPAWDRAGRMMGQIVHKDLLLLQDVQSPSPKRRGSAVVFCEPESKAHPRRSYRVPGQQGQQEHMQTHVTSQRDVQIQPHVYRPALDANASTTGVSDASIVEKDRSLPEQSKRDVELSRFPGQNSLGWTSEEASKTAQVKLGKDRGQQSKQDVSSAHGLAASIISWRAQIDERLEDLGMQIQATREEMSEEIEGLRDQICELKRLMHLLLSRLAAEEKY